MTENKREFLPLELQAIQDGNYLEIGVYTSDDRKLIEHIYNARPPAQENLCEMFAFIVRACNAHDDLVAALQAILDDYFAWLESDYTPAFTERFLESQLYKQVSSALAKARGEQ